MRNQQRIWQNEHTSQATLPSMANEYPTSGIVKFTDCLQDHGIDLSGRAVDIGAGKGRNAIHLAQIGFEVWALEYIEAAIMAAKKLARDKKVSDKIQFKLTDIDTRWQFVDDFFDVAIDSFSSIDIETKTGREIYRDEMYRTLKPKGYALVTVCSTNDEWEKGLIANSPGPEQNSTIWPQSGKFQKDYDETELREFYKPFEIVELLEIKKPAFKLGREGIATNFWMVLKKSSIATTTSVPPQGPY